MDSFCSTASSLVSWAVSGATSWAGAASGATACAGAGAAAVFGSNKNPVGYIKDSGMCHVENYTILTFKAWELSYDYWVSSILKTGIWNVL